MTKLYDIIPKDALMQAIGEGYISERYHPVYDDLCVINYTPKAQFENYWTVATKQARGLVFNHRTLEVVARSFAKFFNYGQGEAEFDLDAPLYHVADKMDGSLGIGYRVDGEWAIATRGSFDSEQARHATAWLKEHPEVIAWMDREYEDWDCTPLFEIIYPENRIVVDYGDRDELVILGSVEIAEGAFHPAPGYLRHAAPLGHKTLRVALEAPVRPNSEGMVVWTDPWTAVKIKQADYVELHRIVTGLNRKAVWREVQKGPRVFHDWCAQLPDELYTWALGVGVELHSQYASRMRWIDLKYVDVLEAIEHYRTDNDLTEVSRGEMAKIIQETEVPVLHGYMFSLLDGRDISEKIWRELEPKGGER